MKNGRVTWVGACGVSRVTQGRFGSRGDGWLAHARGVGLIGRVRLCLGWLVQVLDQ
jgi:hypothetical protein